MHVISQRRKTNMARHVRNQISLVFFLEGKGVLFRILKIRHGISIKSLRGEEVGGAFSREELEHEAVKEVALVT